VGFFRFFVKTGVGKDISFFDIVLYGIQGEVGVTAVVLVAAVVGVRVKKDGNISLLSVFVNHFCCF
jgi:hypothetical protein